MKNALAPGSIAATRRDEKKQNRGANASSVFDSAPNLRPHPDLFVPTLATETGVDQKARTFSPWSHVVALLFAQLTHAIGLNDVCDALRLHSGPLPALRAATAPMPNNLSHANGQRDASLTEKLSWSVLDHLKSLHSRFAGSRKGKRLLYRFTRMIHAVDSTTIQLVASCMDWAKHRRRKAAAKRRLRLDRQSFLPSFASSTRPSTAITNGLGRYVCRPARR